MSTDQSDRKNIKRALISVYDKQDSTTSPAP